MDIQIIYMLLILILVLIFQIGIKLKNVLDKRTYAKNFLDNQQLQVLNRNSLESIKRMQVGVHKNQFNEKYYCRGQQIYREKSFDKRFFKEEMACLFWYIYIESNTDFKEGMIRIKDENFSEIIDKMVKSCYSRLSSHYKGMVYKNFGVDIGSVPLPLGANDKGHRTMLIALLNDGSVGIKPEAFGVNFRTPFEFIRHAADYVVTRFKPKIGDGYKKEHDKEAFKKLKSLATILYDNEEDIKKYKQAIDNKGFSYLFECEALKNFIDENSIDSINEDRLGRSSYYANATEEQKTVIKAALSEAKNILHDRDNKHRKGHEVLFGKGYEIKTGLESKSLLPHRIQRDAINSCQENPREPSKSFGR